MMTSSPFQDLSLLQTLDLYSPLTLGLVITASTFTGLKSLRSLSVEIRSTTTATPFIHLPALKHMNLELSACNYPDELFTGLVNLEYINVTHYFLAYCAGTINICPLISLQSLDILYGVVILNKSCLHVIPLKTLDIAFGDFGFVRPFGMLNSLTSLTWKVNMIASQKQLKSLDFQSLNSLHMSLQNLSLTDDSSRCAINLTSTTFQLWPEWKESLQVFKIICYQIFLEGSPFKWFTKLQVLQLSDVSMLPAHVIIPAIAFEGLESLQELHLPNCLFTSIGLGPALQFKLLLY